MIFSGARTLTLLCLQIVILTAQNQKPTEFQVKAAYLSNFGRFVDWPAGAEPGVDGNGSETFSVCVLGPDPFGDALDRALSGDKINGVPLAARRIARVQEFSGCRVLYIAAPEDTRLRSVLAGLAGAPVLTVGDSPDFTLQGGMIQFVLDGNRVRFEVNLTAVQRAHMNLSSELTKLATVVRRNP